MRSAVHSVLQYSKRQSILVLIQVFRDSASVMLRDIHALD
jgi:hypothetical protein